MQNPFFGICSDCGHAGIDRGERAFQGPTPGERAASISSNIYLIPDLVPAIDGRRLLVVDDSIVRGNTSRRIVEMAKEAGAKHVFFASSAPPIVHPNVYGIDMPARNEYVAHGRTIEEIREVIGVDWLLYQELPDLIEACLGAGDTDLASFDCSCFNGEYVTGGITEEYLAKVESMRNDAAKRKASV